MCYAIPFAQNLFHVQLTLSGKCFVFPDPRIMQMPLFCASKTAPTYNYTVTKKKCIIQTECCVYHHTLGRDYNYVAPLLCRKLLEIKALS